MRKTGWLIAVGVLFVRSLALGAVEDNPYMDMSNALGKGVTVVSANPAASVRLVENKVSVGDGATLRFLVKFRFSGRATFAIGGDGKPNVSCDKGAVAQIKDGVCSFNGKVNTTYEVTVSSAGGTTMVSDVKVTSARGLCVKFY